MADVILLTHDDEERWGAAIRTVAPDAEVVFAPPGEPVSSDLRHRVTVVGGDDLPAGLEELTALRWIQLASHGYEGVTGRRLRDGVVVTNASGVQDIPIAEWVLLMMLALGRRFPDQERAQAAHRWERPASFQRQLAGERVGIVGMGNIGREVARTCAALGLEVWAMGRGLARGRPIPERGPRFDPRACSPTTGLPALSDCVAATFGLADAAEFYPHLDHLVIALPGSPGTAGLVDAAALALLPRHAVLVNPARAAVVDEAALASALRSGRLAGAALDAHYREPLAPDDPWWDMPNTIVTPHISGSSASTYAQPLLRRLFTENLCRLRAGEPLLNVIDPRDYRPSD